MNINELVINPRESLAVELKNWIDPDQKGDQAKFIKAVIAMRNNNGGYILVGFNNNTMQPELTLRPENIREKYHVDKIQGLVTRFASDAFEVVMHYPVIEELEYLVIEIASGIKTPVATKSSLLDNNNQVLVKENTVYVRSLHSNNTPSTTEANWKDWKDLMERCFDNREADIGRFIQRNLTPENLRALGILISNTQPIINTEEAEMKDFFLECETRYNQALAARNIIIPPHGFYEIGVIIKGNVPPHKTDRNLLNLINSTNPRYTGWPVWINSSNFSDEGSRPYVQDGAWEALILTLSENTKEWSDHIDFWRIFPTGRFFLLRALQDDIGGSERAPESMTALDFGLAILRTGEAIAAALLFAKALGCEPDNTTVKFGLKWVNLANRQLSSWAQPMRYLNGGGVARQNEFYTEMEIALNSTNAAVCGHLYEVINKLFNLFDGHEIEYTVVEDLFTRLINRRL